MMFCFGRMCDGKCAMALSRGRQMKCLENVETDAVRRPLLYNFLGSGSPRAARLR